MKHKVWALVTGAIRSEIYLRFVLLKLCVMRKHGVIEGIVYSTWVGEIDRVDGLRDELNKLGVFLVETPYIDEALENKITSTTYERQRLTITEGLKKIPYDSFVLKLRSDFIRDAYKFFKELNTGNLYDRVNSFGEFPKMFFYKMTIKWYGFHQYFFGDDRIFFGFKSDLEKNFSPIRKNSITKYPAYAETWLLNGYNIQFTTILKNLWSVLPINFNQIFAYCADKNDDNLKLPRILHRAFASMCVYLYTHINLLNDDGVKSSEEHLHIADLYKNRFRSNKEIARAIKGDFFQSSDADVFKDELLKIATGQSEVSGYTYEEYLELKDFIEKKINDSIPLEECPFVSELQNLDEQYDAAEILLHKYGEEINSIVEYVNDDFDCIGNSIYPRIKVISNEETRCILIKAAIFDRSIKAIIEYLDILKENLDAFDELTWRQTTRNIRMNCNDANLNAHAMYALYKVFMCYFDIVTKHPEVKDTYALLVREFNNTGHSRTLNLKFPLANYSELHRTLLCHLVKTLCNSMNSKTWGWKEYRIVQSLLMIKPEMNPFPDGVVSFMEKKNHFDELKEIQALYGAMHFDRYDWIVSDEVVNILNEADVSKIISYDVMGRKNIETILTCLYGFCWQYPSLNLQISSAIESIGKKLQEPNFIVKLNRFLRGGNLSVTKDDMVYRVNFILLLETLFRKGMLRQNGKKVSEMCFGDKGRQMLLMAFLRLEADVRLEFFSMKNNYELWLHYVPYLQHESSKTFEVPIWNNGQTWPGADRRNKSAFAAYMRLMGSDVFISIEMSARDTAKARQLAKAVGYEEKNSSGSIIRFVTKRFPFKDANDLPQAVNAALDEFCKVGEKVVTALDAI